MKKAKMPIYYGDNGVHEFWESTNHEVLIFRNHGENHWVILIDGKVRDTGRYLLPTVDKAALLVGKNLNLDYTHQWMNPKSGKGNMVLLSI